MVAGGMENGRASNAARVSDVPTFARHPGVFLELRQRLAKAEAQCRARPKETP